MGPAVGTLRTQRDPDVEKFPVLSNFSDDPRHTVGRSGREDLRSRGRGRHPTPFEMAHVEAEELGDEPRPRRPTDFLGRTLEQPSALAQERHPRGQGDSLVEVVRDVHGRQPVLDDPRTDLALQGPSDLPVRRGEGLVKEEEARPGCQRPGQRDPLLLSAGQVRRPTLGQRLEPEICEQLLDAGGHFGFRPSTGPRPVREIVPDRKLREERKVLEDHPDAP